MIYNERQARLWLLFVALFTIALIRLFPDSIQQDGGYHFLFARWAWRHPELFVGVWARPLFTTAFALPALAGYTTAKMFAALIALATSWQGYRLAQQLGLDRAALAIPLLFVQPSLFVISADTMTEPIFALVLVVAMRLDQSGRQRLALVVASLLILARPEGFFVALLWAYWFVTDGRRSGNWLDRLLWLPLLGAGCLIWWVVALAITGDPLFIAHNWPSGWPMTGTIYGTGSWWNYVVRLPEIAGPLLVPCLVAGGILSVRRSNLRKCLELFLLFFILHTILRRYGLLGSAGYPRYFVAISPAVAVLSLAGWNYLASWHARWSPRMTSVSGSIILGLSFLLNFAYFDGAEWIRDVRAVKSMQQWFESNPVLVQRLIWSQAYMCIAFDRDPWENYSFSGDKQRDQEALRQLPSGTLVFWEDRFGPKWHGLTAQDIAEAGYEVIHDEGFVLRGYILPRAFFGLGGPRAQRMYFLYKR